jgi:hypothetical protein
MSGKKSKKTANRNDPKPAARVKPKLPEPIKWREHFVTLIVLFILPILLYVALPFLKDPNHLSEKQYVLDDKMVLSENQYVKEGVSGIWSLITEDTWQGYLRARYKEEVKDSTVSYEQYLKSQESQLPGGRYRPLSLISFALEYDFFGLTASSYFIVNVLLYGLTAVLIFILLAYLFPLRDGKWWNIPFIAALLFALHPIHTEVVANIKSRDDILAMLFSLASLYIFLKYFQSGKKQMMWVGTVLFFLAIMAKENAITFLAIIPLTAYFFHSVSFKKLFNAMLPLLGVTLVYVFIRTEAVGYFFDSGKAVFDLMNDPFVEAKKGEKLPTIFFTLWLYLQLLFFPLQLTHDYYPYQVPLMSWDDFRATLSFILYLALGVYSLLVLKKRKVIAYCFLYFVITLSIVSNLFLSIGTFMNERFVYMPSLGFCIFLAFVCVTWLPKIKKIPAPVIIGMTIIAFYSLGFAYKTVIRVPDWKTDKSLSFSAVKVSFNSSRANQFCGYYLYRDALEEKDSVKQIMMLDEALPYIDKALKIYPEYSESLKTKAGIMAAYFQQDGNLDKLLNSFYDIQMVKQTPFVDQYLNYLDPRADRKKMQAFYMRLGFALTNSGDSLRGNYYKRKAGI